MGLFDFLESHLDDAADIGSKILGDGGDSGAGGGFGGLGNLGGLGDLGDLGDLGNWSGSIGRVIDTVAGEGSGGSLWSNVTDQLHQFIPDDVSGLADSVLSGNGSWAGQLVDTASNMMPDGWGAVTSAAHSLGLSEDGVDGLLQRGAQLLQGNGDTGVDQLLDLGRQTLGGFVPDNLMDSNAATQVVQQASSLLGEGDMLDGMSDVVPQLPATQIDDDVLGTPMPSQDNEGDDGLPDQFDNVDDSTPTYATDDLDQPEQGYDDPGFDAAPQPADEPMDDFSQDIADADDMGDDMVDDMFDGLS